MISDGWSVLIWIACGGALGAVLRGAVYYRWAAREHPAGKPWYPTATVIVNLVGSFALGLLTGISAADRHAVFGWMLAIGVCGALTTFATFARDLVQLGRAGRWRACWLHASVNVVGGFTAAAAAWRIGQWLSAQEGN